MQIDDQHTSVYDFVTDGTPADVAARYASLKTQALHADYGDLDRNIVVIDTETTGVSERKDELTQIAAARLERGEITEWFVTFVNPGKPIPTLLTLLRPLKRASSSCNSWATLRSSRTTPRSTAIS